jgi:hypothetical protein
MNARTFSEILEATRLDFKVFSQEELIHKMASLRWVLEDTNRLDHEAVEPPAEIYLENVA